MRTSMKCPDSFGQNLRMNNDVYKLRQNVISIIYMVKAMGINLPRIEVRVISTKDASLLGCANLGENKVWIVDSEAKSNSARLYHVVLHELVHAVKGIGHIDGCPLMDAYITPTRKAILDRLFRQYMK